MKKVYFSGIEIKMIAIFCMCIQHMAYGNLFHKGFYDYAINIGYIVFPLIMFMLVEGFIYTQNLQKYMGRILVCMVVSELPYRLYFYNKIVIGSLYFENIMAALVIALFSLYFWNRFQGSILMIVFTTFISVILTEFFKTDYGFYTIYLAYIFYFFREYKTVKIILLFFLFMIKYMQIFLAICLILIILLYRGVLYRENNFNKTKKYKLQVFFYLFYPLHFLILYFIKCMVLK